MNAAKILVVNADDFGFTRDVNAGIVEAHRNGIVTAATLMAGGHAFEHAVRLARENPALDVGCHLVLAGGNSALPPHRPLPATLGGLVRAFALGRLRIDDELRAQVRRIIDAGIEPTHLDTHKHTHLLPPVLDAVARISLEFGIRWVRRPLPVPLLGPLLGMTLVRHRCRMTDRFAGFRLTGRLNSAALVHLIRRLPEGTTELMCHPGYLREDLRAARTRLKESRQLELEALTSPQAKHAIQAAGVLLANYRSLGSSQ